MHLTESGTYTISPTKFKVDSGRLKKGQGMEGSNYQKKKSLGLNKLSGRYKLPVKRQDMQLSTFKC